MGDEATQRPSTDVTLGLLGPLDLRVDGEAVAVPGHKRQAVLALLGLHVNQVVSVDRLIERVWGAQHPPTAQAALRNCVSALRRLLPEDPAIRLETVDRGYRLRAVPEAVDVEKVRRILPQARLTLAEGEAEQAADLLRTALRLWRGPALVDLLARYPHWPELVELEELRLHTLEQRIAADLALGRHRGLVAELERLVRAHPTRERLYHHHMTALYGSGRQGHAIAAYHRARSVLTARTGRQPGHELDELYLSILRQRPPEPVRHDELRTATMVGLRLRRPAAGRHGPLPDGPLPDVALPAVAGQISRYGGRVEQVIGSTVLLSFGLAETDRDPAVAAVQAALAVPQALADSAATLAVTAATAVTGPVLARRSLTGAAGPIARIVGRPVDDCAAMLESTPDGVVRVCEQTYLASRDVIRYARYPPPPMTATGLAVAPTWMVHPSAVPRPAPTGTSQPARRRDGDPHRGLGRDVELSLLTGLLERAVTGHRPHLCTILGPAGSGKTSLVEALVEIARRRMRSLTWRLLPASRISGMDGWHRQVAEIMTAGPALLVVEDAHDAETALLDAVSTLTGVPAVLPLLVVVTARHELLARRPGWGAGHENAITLTVAGAGGGADRTGQLDAEPAAALRAGRARGDSPYQLAGERRYR